MSERERDDIQHPRRTDQQEAPASFESIGATEDDEANRDTAIAPGFTDFEPGAGPDQYGPSGSPGAFGAPQDPNETAGPGFTAPEALGEDDTGTGAGNREDTKQ